MKSNGSKTEPAPRPARDGPASELRQIVQEAVFQLMGVESMMELDRMLGRCPFCHGEQTLLDTATYETIPCLCTHNTPVKYKSA